MKDKAWIKPMNWLPITFLYHLLTNNYSKNTRTYGKKKIIYLPIE